MRMTGFFPAVALAAGMLVGSQICPADTVVLDAVQDTYIRSGAKNGNFDFDTNAEGKVIQADGWIGVFQFDLSGLGGLTITSASMQGYLFEDPVNDYNTTDFNQNVYLVETNAADSFYDGGIDEAAVTFNTYVDDGWGAAETKMDSLGVYAQATGDTPNEYKTWGSASANDLVKLNNRAKLSNANQRYALFSLDSAAGSRWWDDHEAGNPIQLVLEVIPDPLPEIVIDRSTGNMRLQNNSGAPITNVIGYTMTSDIGAFDQAQWIPISGNYDVDGNGTVDPDDAWTVLTNSGAFTDLSEVGFGGNGMNLADAADKNLGDAWIQNITEDVGIAFLLGDGSIKPGTVTFVGGDGSPYNRSDLDFDNDIDVDDYLKFAAGLDKNLSGLSPAQAYQMGDLDYDGVNSFEDFNLFVTDYEASNGEGSFAAMLAGIPEPSSALLFVLASCVLPASRRWTGISLRDP